MRIPQRELKWPFQLSGIRRGAKCCMGRAAWDNFLFAPLGARLASIRRVDRNLQRVSADERRCWCVGDRLAGDLQELVFHLTPGLAETVRCSCPSLARLWSPSTTLPFPRKTKPGIVWAKSQRVSGLIRLMDCPGWLDGRCSCGGVRRPAWPRRRSSSPLRPVPALPASSSPLPCLSSSPPLLLSPPCVLSSPLSSPLPSRVVSPLLLSSTLSSDDSCRQRWPICSNRPSSTQWPRGCRLPGVAGFFPPPGTAQLVLPPLPATPLDPMVRRCLSLSPPAYHPCPPSHPPCPLPKAKFLAGTLDPDGAAAARSARHPLVNHSQDSRQSAN